MGAGVSHVTAGAPRGEGKTLELLQPAPSELGGGGQAVPQFPPLTRLKLLPPGRCRKPAPASAEAEQIPSLSSPSATAFFPRLLLGISPPFAQFPAEPAHGSCLGGLFLSGDPQLIPRIPQLPAAVSLPTSNPAAGPAKGWGRRGGNELTVR